MAVTYTGASSPTYITQDYPQLNNGAQASSHTFRNIAKNQTWLGYSDPSELNLWQGPARRFSKDAQVGKFLVDIPPGVTEVEIKVLLCRTRELKEGVTETLPAAFVAEAAITGDSVRVRHIDVTLDNKKQPGIGNALWYTMPRLKVAAASRSYWRRDWITLSTEVNETGIWVFCVHYRHIPIEGDVPFDVTSP